MNPQDQSTTAKRLDLPGFADPVGQSQSCFRALLDALSRPGTLHDAGAGLAAPAPLDPATAAVLLTLVDGDAPLHIAADCAPATDWLVFHCSTTPVASWPGKSSGIAEAPPEVRPQAGDREAH